MGSIKGFGSHRSVRRIQGLRERGAGHGRRDEHHRRSRWAAVRHRRADRRLRHRPAPGDRHCSAALQQANRTGKGQYVEVAMMDGVMNLCRVKFRDHQRLTRGDAAGVFRAHRQAHATRRAPAMIPAAASWATPSTASRTAPTTDSMSSCRKRSGMPWPSVSDGAAPDRPTTRALQPSAEPAARTSTDDVAPDQRIRSRTTPSAKSWRC